MDEDYVFLPALSLEDKYNKLIWSGILFVVLGLLCVGGVFSYQYMKGVYHLEHQTFGQISLFFFFFIAGYGLTIFRQGFNEKRLYYKAAMNGLMLDEQGISGPIALLEGPVRDRIRDTQKSNVFCVPWKDIESFIVEPSRGKKKQAPPYYKVCVVGGDGGLNTSYFILRNYFKGREQIILAYLANRLQPEQIILNDEISPKEVEEEKHNEQ